MSIRTSSSRGFSTLEFMMVMGIMFILLGFVSISVVSLISSARQETALSQISAVFKAARQAALATGEARQVVIRAVYDAESFTLEDVYAKQPVFQYWIERKRFENHDWDYDQNSDGEPDNRSFPLDDIQQLPPSVYLVDINGRSVIPLRPETVPPDDSRETRSVEFYIVFNPQGRVELFYRQDDLDGMTTLDDLRTTSRKNLALHFVMGTLDLTNIPVQGGSVSYLDSVLVPANDEMVVTVNPVLDSLCDEMPTPETLEGEVSGRMLFQTLYILRLTGQVISYDYGIFPPWCTDVLPPEIEGGV